MYINSIHYMVMSPSCDRICYYRFKDILNFIKVGFFFKYFIDIIKNNIHFSKSTSLGYHLYKYIILDMTKMIKD